MSLARLELGQRYIDFQKTNNGFQVEMIYKNFKEFYWHASCLLDNMARLIYIFGVQGSCYPKNKRERYYTDWSSLKQKKNAIGFKNFMRSRKIKEIANVRNSCTHHWKIPIYITDIGGKMHLFIPRQCRAKKCLKWPDTPDEKFYKKYKAMNNIYHMIKEDYEFIESLQNDIFYSLIKNIPRFEKRYSIEIV